MPRIKNSMNLIESIITEIKKEKSQILVNKNSKNSAASLNLCNEIDSNLACSIILLEKIQKNLESITGIASIAILLSSSVSVLRKVSSNLHEIYPESSRKICQLSNLLASIAFDSALLTETIFDFRQINCASDHLVDEVKLIVDSKINKRHSNVDLLKAQFINGTSKKQ